MIVKTVCRIPSNKVQVTSIVDSVMTKLHGCTEGHSGQTVSVQVGLFCLIAAHPEPEPDLIGPYESSSRPPSYPETQRAALSSAQRIPP